MNDITYLSLISGCSALAGLLVGGVLVFVAQGEFRFKRRKESLDLDLFCLVRRIEAGGRERARLSVPGA